MQTNQIVVINSGSSSIKFAAYEFNSALGKSLHGSVENIQAAPTLKIFDANDAIIKEDKFNSDAGYAFFFDLLLSSFASNRFNYVVSAVGHRVAHGGPQYTAPVLITNKIIQDLKEFIPFTPLHQPYNLEAIESIQSSYPNLPQVACFDTAFHRTHPDVADYFGLPRDLTDAGVRRYGFHGLSYEYIMHKIREMDESKYHKRIIVAHLGNGASMCAIKQGKAIDTTMGFTALDGLVMGTRCGSLDPGVLLYLMQHKKMTYQGIQEMLYKKSGLLGVSGISSNMKILLQDATKPAKEAVELFVYRIRRELGALTEVLGGLDILIFTGGIGEHAWQVRERVCADNEWLGIKMNPTLNKNNQTSISDATSNVEVLVIPTNEEWMIARQTYDLINKE